MQWRSSLVAGYRMKCRQVLLKHLEQRKQSLEEYKRICSCLDDSHLQYAVDHIRRRNDLLVLELPYEINFGNLSPKDKSYMEEASYEERTTWNRIKERNPEMNAEHLREIDWQRKATQDIESLPQAQSSKEVRKSHLRSIIKGVGPKRIHLAPRNIIDAESLASYFAYLEKRCLDAWEIQPFRDLLEVRLLFYTSLPVSQLRKICFKDIDFAKQLICWENRSYPLPKTFIELAESILSSEDLVVRGIKQLNKFISQTTNAKRAEVLCKITTKTIQKSLGWIYQEYGIMPQTALRR